MAIDIVFTRASNGKFRNLELGSDLKDCVLICFRCYDEKAAEKLEDALQDCCIQAFTYFKGTATNIKHLIGE